MSWQQTRKHWRQPVQHNRQGIALADQGRFCRSENSPAGALQVWPSFSEALGNLANIHFYQGLYDEAVACYQQALRLKPDDAGVHNNLGNCLCGRYRRSRDSMPAGPPARRCRSPQQSRQCTQGTGARPTAAANWSARGSQARLRRCSLQPGPRPRRAWTTR